MNVYSQNREKHAATVLLVDRDPDVARRIIGYLKARQYSVEWVDDGEKAFNLLDARLFDVLITELNIRRVDGMRLMAVARGRNPDVCVVFITDQADIELATEAMRQGAYDFQIKPVNLGKLEAVIQRGLAYQRLVYRQHELRRRLDEHFGLGSLVGRSRQMARVYDAVRQYAPGHDPVLIYGESGTGKDLIAQAIHTNGPRRDEPFVKMICAEGPEGRLEQEFFGATGQAGKIELAENGTLYLDEVDSLNARLQAVLLELVNKKRLQRTGGKRSVSVDIRVIAATRTAITSLNLNAALLERLRASYIEAPALRDRPEDIPLLVQHFAEEISQQRGFSVPQAPPNVMDLLMRYRWPGNVRELRNVIEGMALTRRGEQSIDVYDVPEYIRRAAHSPEGDISIKPGTPMAEVERIVIAETLRRCGYNKTLCAKILGIGLRTLYRKLHELNLG